MESDTESNFDLDEALALGRELVGRGAPYHPQHLQRVAGLATFCWTKFQETQDVVFLDEAIQTMTTVMAVPELAAVIDRAFEAQLGGLYYARFQEHPTTQDRDRAIELLSIALPDLQADGKEGSPEMRTYYLKALSGAFHDRYTKAKAVRANTPFDDMAAALRFANMALLNPDPDTERVKHLLQLAVWCWESFRITGNVTFVETAIRHLRTGLEMSAVLDQYEIAIRLMNVSEFSWAWYDQVHDPELLDQSIRAGQEAAAADPDALTCDFWHNLSCRFKIRHRITNSRDDLKEAIDCAKRAVGLAAYSNQARAGYLKNYATSLTSWYLETKSLDDLEVAIRAHRAAVDATPEGHALRVENLNNMGLTIFYRYERLRERGDLDECLTALKESVALSDAGSQGWRRRLSNLLPRLMERNSGQEVEPGKRVQIIPDYDRIQRAAESLSDITQYAADVVKMLKILYGQVRNEVTLGDAICLAREVLRATSANDDDNAERLLLLCDLLQERAQLHSNLDDIEAAITQWKAAGNTANPTVHFMPRTLIGLSSALLLKHINRDDEEVSVLTSSMQAAASAWYSAEPDDPRRLEYWRHMQQFPGIKLAGPGSEVVTKHSCPNCKVLWASLTAEPVEDDTVSLKKLAYDESTGKMVATPFTPEDAAGLPKLLARMVHIEPNASIRTSSNNLSTTNPTSTDPTSTDPSSASLATTGFRSWPVKPGIGSQGIRLIDRLEIEGKAPLPEQAEFYFQKSQQDNSIASLNTAISMLDYVVKNTGADNVKRARYCGNLAIWLHARYKLTHVPEDIDRAISMGCESVEHEANHPGDKVDFYQNLAAFYEARWNDRHDKEDLEELILSLMTVRNGLSEGSADRNSISTALADNLHQRFRLVHEREDLDEAIETLEQDVDRGHDDHEEHAVRLNVISHWYMERYHVFGSQADLDSAVRSGREAEESCRASPKYLSIVRFGLAQALYFRFEVTGNTEELESAITILKEITDGESTKSDAASRSIWLASLGTWLCVRGMVNLDTHDFNESVRLCRMAIAEEPEGSVKTVYLLKTLGHSLGMRYQHSGRVQDVEEAISMVQRACRLESSGKSTEQGATKVFEVPDGLDELGTLYFCRFNALGARKDLDESIRLGAESLETNTKTMFPGHPRKCQALINLGNRYGLRYLRYRDFDSLRQAVSLSHRALEEELQAGTDNMSGTLPSLAHWILMEVELVQDASLLRRFIPALENKLSQTAVTQTRRRVEILLILSRFYLATAKVEEGLQKREDLDTAQKLAEDALGSTTPAWSMKRCDILNHLGTLLEQKSRIDSESAPALLSEAAKYYLESSKLVGGPVLFRISSAKSAGQCFGDLGRWQESSSAFKVALDLLPYLTPSSIERDDQEEALKAIGALASNAAAAALQAGNDPSSALLQLESGRGLISSLLIKARSDISRLEMTRPDIAERYETLRSQRARPLAYEDAAASLGSDDRLSRVQEDIRELTILEESIRAIPGFKDFQSQLSIQQIKELALSGPLVSFNVSRWSSIAFYVTSDGHIGSIPLPDLKMEDLRAKVELLIGKESLAFGPLSTRPARNQQLRDILTWLWSVAAEPVLRVLDMLSPKAEERLPRLFWVASGPMGSMPLHAATDFRNGGEERVARYVVSTYVPTLKSLDYARKLAARRGYTSNDLQTLVVTGPGGTLGAGRGDSQPVLQTQEEVIAIETAASKAQIMAPKCLTGRNKADILEQVAAHQIVHFGCHGMSNPDSPSDSGLFIESSNDGAKSPQEAIPQLRVRELAEITYARSWLAYLSACSTAELSAVGLADEAIHMASAFQIAGFPHVIGTLWECQDKAAVVVTSRFYLQLFGSLAASSRENDPARWDDSAVAYALHDAVEALKSEGVPMARRKIRLYNDPLAWAPFIHVGI